MRLEKSRKCHAEAKLFGPELLSHFQLQDHPLTNTKHKANEKQEEDKTIQCFTNVHIFKNKNSSNLQLQKISLLLYETILPNLLACKSLKIINFFQIEAIYIFNKIFVYLNDTLLR